MLGKDNKRRTHLTETFQSQIKEERGSKFLMDKTLYKGIRQNDVSKIIDISKQGGQLDDKSLPSQLGELQKIVIQMRKKYDQTRTQYIQVESQLQKLRKTSETLKTEQTRLKELLSGAKNNLQTKQKQLDGLFASVQARTYDSDIYKQMIATLKHDILAIKKRNFDKDVKLKQEKVKVKTLQTNDFHKTQMSYKCRDMLQSVQKTVITKQYERNSKLNTFYDALNKKHQNLKRREEREKEIEEVMMKAMGQKLQQEKEWINICFINLFLKKFLKSKMERLISENAEVEGAYHKIRSNTEIKDCKDLITKFLNRQKDYGTLLWSISQKQAKLNIQKSEKQKLQAKHSQLRQVADQISDSVHKVNKDQGPLSKELDMVEQSLIDIEQKKQLISKWATRFFSSYRNVPRQQINLKYQNRSLKQLLKDVLMEISKYTEHLLGDENSSNNINNAFYSTRPSDKTFDDEMVNRNKRVKTTAVQDSFVEGEDKEAFYDGGSEVQYLHYNRKLTKKNDLNRRFRIKTQNK